MPGYCDNLGGMVISLSMLARGFIRCNAAEHFQLLVRTDSLMEDYLINKAGTGAVVKGIPGGRQSDFFIRAMDYVNQFPSSYPLLLENCVSRELMKPLASSICHLRRHQRPIYHMFRDQALSYNPLGNIARRGIFYLLAPEGFSNSHYTASAVEGRLVKKVSKVLYPAVDTDYFNSQPLNSLPPENLRPLLLSGGKILLTAARISSPGGVNDKNLMQMPEVLGYLNAAGNHYWWVVMGLDSSPEKRNTQRLIEKARRCGVEERFVVLPPTFNIVDYYKSVDCVVTLAPREPFGRTVVEAVACGVPVVGFASGGVGEILKNFAPAWTIHTNHPAAASGVISSVLHSIHVGSQIAAGQRWIRQNCSPVSYAHKLMEITNIQSQANQLPKKIAA
ncbi:MAG: glycosyltransferase [Cyanobacteria bacterium P01_H01_bin.15]